jgi:signal transduction histidine kinase
MITLTLIAALLSFGVTIGVLWVNPHRFSNQVFALVTLIQALALGIVYRAKTIAELRPPDYIEHFESLLRANAATIAFLPASIWLLKNAIILPNNRRRAINRSVPLFVLSIFTVCVCYSDKFIFLDNVGFLQRGPAYYIYSFMALGVYSVCLLQIIGQMRTNTGIRRVELQFLALNIGGAALLLAALNALGNYFEIPALKSAGVVFMLLASALTAWALLFHRVFNAGELLLQLGQRMLFVLTLMGGIYAVWQISTILFPEPLSLVISVGLFSPVAIWIDRKSRDWFDHTSRKKLIHLRAEAFQIASYDFDTRTLVTRFEELLRNECRSGRASLHVDDGTHYTGSDFTIVKNSAVVHAAVELGWATPESLVRRRSKPELESLKKLMAANCLGLLLSVPRNSPTPTMLVSLGSRVDESPFTYPEIQRLQNVVELIDGVLMRSKIMSDASLKSRIDYLSMASRGLAHDLKNLIMPIWTWMLHEVDRYPPKSTEADVYNRACRALRVMKNYIDEAIFFTERLHPHFESVDLISVAQEVCDITVSRAANRSITVRVESENPEIVVADKVLLQRSVANLVNNAIDASSPGKEVVISISSVQNSNVQIAVRDTGTGVSLENISRIFDPYFTTKCSGDNVRGFGLGLTIVQRIAFLHQGNVSVRSSLKSGTTIVIELPRKPHFAWVQSDIAL